MQKSEAIFFLGFSPFLITFLLYVFAHLKIALIYIQLRQRVGEVSPKEYENLTKSFALINMSLFTVSRFVRSNDLEEFPQILQLKNEFRRYVKILFFLFIALIIIFPLNALLMFLLTMILST